MRNPVVDGPRGRASLALMAGTPTVDRMAG